MKYQFSTECTWLYLFLRTVRRAKSCTRVRATTLTYVKPQIANCISTLATPLSAGQSTGTSSCGNAFLPFGIAT